MKGPSAMTQSIDQAPKNNPDHNGGGDEHQNHPELVSRGSQSLLGGEIPANLYEPAPLDRDPRQKTRRNLIIAGSALAFTGIASTALYFGAKSEVRQIANEMQNPLPGNSAPVVPGQIDGGPTLYQGEDYTGDGVIDKRDYDLMPPSGYVRLDEKVHTEDNAAEINQYLSSAWDTIQSHLTPADKAFLRMPDLNKPRDQWSDQDYYNNYTLALWLASTQGNTQQQINEGKRTLASVLSPSFSGFSDTMDAIGQTGPLKNTYEAQTSEFTGINLKPGAQIDGILIDESGGRLARGRYIETGQISYDVFVNRTDSEGNVVSVLARSYKSLLVPELQGVL